MFYNSNFCKPYIRVCTNFSSTTGPKVYFSSFPVIRYTTANINGTAVDLSSYTEEFQSNNFIITLGSIFYNIQNEVPSDVTFKIEKSATEDFASTTTIKSFTIADGFQSKIDYTIDTAKPWIRGVLSNITSGFRLRSVALRTASTTPSYLQTNTNGALKFLTIADFTFIVNPSIVVKENTAKTPDSVGDLLIYTPTTLGGYTDIGLTLGTVKGSLSDNYDEESSSEIWGLLMDEFITSIDSSNIITLDTALKTADNTVYGFSFAPGILWVDFRGDDVVFSTTGESTTQRLRAITDTVTSFSQLPSYCVEGFKVKILNTDKFDEDDYYVQFFPNSSQTSEISVTYTDTDDTVVTENILAHVDADEKIKIGRWVETIAPDINIGLDRATMPMTLRRRSDGSFHFSGGNWSERKVGDNISNSHPSFVGRTINHIDLYNNRLVFLSGDNIVLSELGEFFNFYRTTALTLLDSDPIDIASSGTSVSMLHSSIGFHNSLIVFSKDKQYSLTSGNPAYNLTPATINFPIISSFSSLVDVEPLALGNTIFFAVESGNHTGIKEYFITQDDSNQGDAVDITASVPKLLPKRILKLVGSSTENLLIVLPDNTENINTTDSGVYVSGYSELFVYKYYWQGNEKIQSAWNKWTFEGMYIADIFIIDELLYIIYVDNVGTHIGSLPISEGYTDISEDSGQIGIGLGGPAANPKILKTIYLDKQISNAQITTEYFSVADETVITLPFEVTNTHTWYIVSTSDDDNPGEEQVLGRDPSNSPLTDGVKANGDWTGRSFVIGLKYNQLVTLSPLFIVDETTGAIDKRSEILLKNMSIGYGDANTFKVITRHLFENKTETTVFDVTDNPYYTEDIPLGTGDFKFSIQGINKEIDITLLNDSWAPCSWINADWEADIVPLSKNV